MPKAKASPTKTTSVTEVVIPEIRMETTHVTLIGKTPLFVHRMSAKAKRQLMIGGRKKTTAEKLEIKHYPREEFRDCMLIEKGKNEHTAVWFDAMAIKSAMGTAALVVPGIRKTDVARLVFIPSENIPIFGVPELFMNVMRSSDINRTPDIRTRAYFPRWATQIEIQHAVPSLPRASILSLLHNAGVICGIGDSRQEKGRGSFGTFRIAESSKDLKGLLDLDAQLEAIDNPKPANVATAELLAEFDAEVAARS